ncbi:sigma-E processing peptidase SpoIIGA [Paenibacillus eucommiae]|uniref:Sporulation sigma-E factor-processing peptidase n=1 Tax=Paenibacillus eucommiae TaxID=1355755 RepID=A0ABS4IZ17_9BACL|nr:sigma-E processing peptidase SpoIIGA [Paenibacillus eucommiae]MBP1992788.1 stage II sporulation protein GA (sporulation sigma-E factor processing peptidase) [Paenibacillus eucommiae]
MVVYADLIFLLNLLMDAAMLIATVRVRKLKVRWWRIASSAGIGASYVVLMFVPALSIFFTFSVKCLFCIAMILTAFGFGSLQHFLRNLGTFLLINFVTAGGIFGIHYFFQSSGNVMNGIMFTHSGGLAYQVQISLVFILVVAVVMIGWFQTIFSSVKQRGEFVQTLAEVQINIEQHFTSCVGLIDTGNQLFDPLTRTPVMVLEASEWKDILPSVWLEKIRSANVDQIITSMGTETFIWQDRMRLVPYKGVNRNTEFMLAIKPDKVVIVHKDQKYESVKVLIGLHGGKLCSDGSYSAIIHPTLVATV